MKLKPIVGAALVALLAGHAGAAEPKAETPLVVDGKVTVDVADFHAGIHRAPEERRIELRTSYDRIATVVDNLFITRSLAERARAEGLDKDPTVQRRMQQAAEGILMDVYRNKVLREVNAIDLDQRARELYRADPSKFVLDEHVHIQHILVNLVGRTREQGLARAKMIAEKAQAQPNDFLTFAQQYSDDPERRGNRGDLGLNSPKSFSENLRNALATMKPGQVSEPIETEHGFHIVKFIERQPARPLPFEVVKEQLVRTERQQLFKQRMDQIVMEIRNSPTVTTYPDNVQALVVPLPAELTGKPAGQAANTAAPTVMPAAVK